jgi:hypothetical protein
MKYPHALMIDGQPFLLGIQDLGKNTVSYRFITACYWTVVSELVINDI